jgi:hypothetical protein
LVAEGRDTLGDATGLSLITNTMYWVVRLAVFVVDMPFDFSILAPRMKVCLGARLVQGQSYRFEGKKDRQCSSSDILLAGRGLDKLAYGINTQIWGEIFVKNASEIGHKT